MQNSRKVIDTTKLNAKDFVGVVQSKRLKVLVLCRYSASQGSVVIDSINSLKNDSHHDVFIYSNHLTPFSSDFPYEKFDVIVVHYSIIPTLSGFIDVKTVHRVASLKCCKVLMAQDEYRCTTGLIDFANAIEANFFFTVIPPSAAINLYGNLNPTCSLVHYLTGYIPEALTWFTVPKISSRKWDLTYRGRIYPEWFGGIITLKVNTALNFLGNRYFSGLALNISVNESDRVYGIDYVNLLAQSKTTYATESSVEIVDDLGYMMHFENCFGQLSSSTGDHRFAGWYRNLLGFGQLSSSTGDHNIRAKEQAASRYLRPFPGELSVIAPRIFESIAMRTVLIMPPGHYSGLLKAWDHYIPIMPDLSNAEEVSQAIKNEPLLCEIASRAFAEIAMNKSLQYSGFTKRFDFVLDEFHCNLLSKVNPDDRGCIIDLSTQYPLVMISNPHGVSFRQSRVRLFINKHRHHLIVNFLIIVIKKILWRKS